MLPLNLQLRDINVASDGNRPHLPNRPKRSMAAYCTMQHLCPLSIVVHRGGETRINQNFMHIQIGMQIVRINARVL